MSATEGSATAAAPPGAAGPSPPPPGDLRGRAARGTLVNAAFEIGLTSLGLVKGFVVAAFLTRSEYGIWGILVIVLISLLWLKQVGIGDKYIQQREGDQRLAFQKAFTLELAFNGAFLLVLAAAMPLVAVVYGQPALIAPGLVLSLAVIPVAFQTPTWVWYRSMRFGRQRAIQAVDPVVGFVVTVVLAVAGLGYWALVIGTVVGATAGAVVAVATSPYPLALRYDRGTLRSYAAFSWPLILASASTLVIAQSSLLVGERVLGLAAVGAITLASSVSDYTNRVDQIVTQTLYPAICAVRDRREALFESFVKSNRLALMWGMPFGVGLALFASDLVHFGLGDRWQPAVVLLQVFGVLAAINHVAFNWDAYFRADGRTRPIAVVAGLSMVTFCAVALPLMAADGLDGLAIGMAATAAVSLVARSLYLTTFFDGFQILTQLARAAWPVLPAVGLVLAVRALEDGRRTLGIALAELAVYVLAVVVVTSLAERALLREALGYLRRGARVAPA
jgi:PST family polysaccharide transporter